MSDTVAPSDPSCPTGMGAIASSPAKVAPPAGKVTSQAAVAGAGSNIPTRVCARNVTV